MFLLAHVCSSFNYYMNHVCEQKKVVFGQKFPPIGFFLNSVFYFSVFTLIHEHLKCCFTSCSTSFWCCNGQSVPLPHNSARGRGRRHILPFTSLHQRHMSRWTWGVTELWNKHFPISLKVSPLIPWEEDGRRCGWRGRDSVPAHGEWCSSPLLSHLSAAVN